MTADQKRQEALLSWISERPEHERLTAEEIVNVSGLYDKGPGRHGRCLVDLARLTRLGYLVRDARLIPARPARFRLSKAANSTRADNCQTLG